MTYIYERKNWPRMTWDTDAFLPELTEAHRHCERFSSLFDRFEINFRNEAIIRTLSVEVVKSSQIEGEKIDVEQVHKFYGAKVGC